VGPAPVRAFASRVGSCRLGGSARRGRAGGGTTSFAGAAPWGAGARVAAGNGRAALAAAGGGGGAAERVAAGVGGGATERVAPGGAGGNGGAGRAGAAGATERTPGGRGTTNPLAPAVEGGRGAGGMDAALAFPRGGIFDGCSMTLNVTEKAHFDEQSPRPCDQLPTGGNPCAPTCRGRFPVRRRGTPRRRARRRPGVACNS
jgi:hypothetical protein